MNEQNVTSVEFSKWLDENGCLLQSDYWWCRSVTSKSTLRLSGKSDIDHHVIARVYPAFDILNDICVRHVKPFFGYEVGIGTHGERLRETSWQYHTEVIFKFIQNKMKQRAENYIKEHCVFNPENKEG